MNYTFQTDLRKRKDYLRLIAKKDPSWLFRMLCFWLLMALSAGILIGIGFALFSAKNPPEPATIMIFCMAGVCIACVPFFIGISVKNMLEDLKKTGCHLVTIGASPDEIGTTASFPIDGSVISSYAAYGIYFIAAAQNIAFERALERGVNPDQPKGLDAYITLK